MAGVPIALLLLSAGSASAESMLFLVTVNTSSVNGTSGFLDFQFNPDQASSQLALAEITDFNAGGGTLVFNANSPQLNGDVAGTLPNPVTLVNDTSLNEMFQQFNYGSFFSFLLYLTGPALDHPNGTSPAGSEFGLGLFDQDQNEILTGPSSAFAGEAIINLDGTVTTQTFPERGSVVSFQVLPEPGTPGLLALGATGLLLLGRRRLVHN